jgi:hypothetical protein
MGYFDYFHEFHPSVVGNSGIIPWHTLRLHSSRSLPSILSFLVWTYTSVISKRDTCATYSISWHLNGTWILFGGGGGELFLFKICLPHPFYFTWQKCNHNIIIIIIIFPSTTFCSNLIQRWHFKFKIINYALMVRYAAGTLNLNFSPTLRELTNALMWNCMNIPVLTHMTQCRIS